MSGNGPWFHGHASTWFNARMSTFLLIHGAWHGAWCWYKLVPRLEKIGHTVVAPDLPALGRDRTPVNRVSLATWRDFVCEIVDALPEPVVLVGHSRGGIVISEVAEHRPTRFARSSISRLFCARDGAVPVRPRGTGRRLARAAEHGDVRRTNPHATVREDAIRAGFYGECSDEDFALARRACIRSPPCRSPRL